MRTILAALCSLCLGSLAQAQSLEGDLADLLDEARHDSAATAIVLLIDDGEDPFVVIDGDATAETRFYLASVGKSIVAAGVLSAVQAGALTLDAPLGARVADLPLGDLAATRSLRQLLDHSSGLPDYLDDGFVDAVAARPTHRFTPAEALAWADPDAASPAGRDFDYSNTNYVLLGALLDQIDGDLGTALQKRVFGPAGMRDAGVGATAGPNLARGFDEDGRDVSTILWNSTLGDGPVVASAPDLARFIRALFETDAILGPVMRADMLREGVAGSGYGLGIGVERDEFGTWYGHSGGFEGAATDFRYYPDMQTSFILLANGDMDLDWVMDEAVALWFDD